MMTVAVAPAKVKELAKAINLGDTSAIEDATQDIAGSSYDQGVADADLPTDPPGGDKLKKIASFAPLLATLAAGISDSTSVDDVAVGIASSAYTSAVLDSCVANGRQFEIVPDDGACEICLAGAGTFDLESGADAPPFHPGCGCSIQPAQDDSNTDDEGSSQRMRRSSLDISMAKAFPSLVRAITESERRRGSTTERRGSPVWAADDAQALQCARDDVSRILSAADPQTQVAQSSDDQTIDIPAGNVVNGVADGTRAQYRSGARVSGKNLARLQKAYALLHAAAHDHPIGPHDSTQDDGTQLAPGNSPIQSEDGTGSRAKRAKDKYSADQLQALHKAGKALKSPKDGHILLPVADHEDIKNAVTTVGLVTHISKAKARKHIAKGAKALGADYLIPDNWNADGTLKPGKRWKNRDPFGRRLGIPFIKGAS